ncbi:MAG TPA: response regulator [Acetobacteraceae bacterium]|nr:response regulator [Acetobacteraceae bacterium]
MEDDAPLRSMLAEFLRLEGFTVLETGAVADAKRVLSVRPNIQLVLTDIQMPGGQSGIDLARYVQQTYPAVPILLVSGYFDQTAPEEFPLIRKPFGLQKLLSVVQMLLSNSAPPV